MAKKGLIENNKKKMQIVSSYKTKRDHLKKIIYNKSLSLEERYKAQTLLQKMPRNASKVRIRNRCSITGRPRGYHRDFGLCRIKLREYAFRGFIPGITMSSW